MKSKRGGGNNNMNNNNNLNNSDSGNFNMVVMIQESRAFQEDGKLEFLVSSS